MDPKHPDRRPTAQEYAEHLLASFDLSPESEVDIVRESLRQRLAVDSSDGGLMEVAGKARGRHEARFIASVDGHLSALRSFKGNSAIDIAGRFISELSFCRGDSEKPDIVGLIDIRGRDGRSIAMTETRLFVMEEGVALVEGRSRHRGHEFAVRTLLAPRTYAAELGRFAAAVEVAGETGGALKELEQNSLLYHLMRGALADRHGPSASWYRGIATVVPLADSDSGGGFLFRIAPHADFFVRPHYEPSTCRIFVETRRC